MSQPQATSPAAMIPELLDGACQIAAGMIRSCNIAHGGCTNLAASASPAGCRHLILLSALIAFGTELAASRGVAGGLLLLQPCRCRLRLPAASQLRQQGGCRCRLLCVAAATCSFSNAF